MENLRKLLFVSKQRSICCVLRLVSQPVFAGCCSLLLSELVEHLYYRQCIHSLISEWMYFLSAILSSSIACLLSNIPSVVLCLGPHRPRAPLPDHSNLGLCIDTFCSRAVVRFLPLCGFGRFIQFCGCWTILLARYGTFHFFLNFMSSPSTRPSRSLPVPHVHAASAPFCFRVGGFRGWSGGLPRDITPSEASLLRRVYIKTERERGMRKRCVRLCR